MDITIKCLPIHSDTNSLSRTFLKSIVLFVMVFDHVAIGFIPPDTVIHQFCRFIGRVGIPIMTFLLVEGYLHTKNIKKYFYRLFVCATVSQIPYSLFFHSAIFDATPNFIFSLLLSLCALVIINSQQIGNNFKFVLIILLVEIAFFCHASFMAVILTICFFIFRSDNAVKWTVYFIVSAIYAVVCYISTPHEFYRFGFVLTPFILIHYCGLRESTSKFTQNFFYIFYPFHLIFLYLAQISKIVFQF